MLYWSIWRVLKSTSKPKMTKYFCFVFRCRYNPLASPTGVKEANENSLTAPAPHNNSTLLTSRDPHNPSGRHPPTNSSIDPSKSRVMLTPSNNVLRARNKLERSLNNGGLRFPVSGGRWVWVKLNAALPGLWKFHRSRTKSTNNGEKKAEETSAC